MKAEKILKAQGIDITLIPTPREISSDCGMVIQVGCTEVNRAKDIINEQGLMIEGVYQLEKGYAD